MASMFYAPNTVCTLHSHIIKPARYMDLLEQFKQITTFILDVDGVLTDGSLLVLDDGQMVRRMNIKDGYAIQLALKRGTGLW